MAQKCWYRRGMTTRQLQRRPKMISASLEEREKLAMCEGVKG